VFPATWDLAKGTNVRFKTPLPGRSLSSPIVWGRTHLRTSAISAKGETPIKTGLYGDGTSVDDMSAHSFRLYALDARTGAIAWEREVLKTPRDRAPAHEASLANATPATDGKSVVVLFGTVGVLAAFDWDGQERGGGTSASSTATTRRRASRSGDTPAHPSSTTTS
jgi:outer membrane protein assembly factor BamB